MERKEIAVLVRQSSARKFLEGFFAKSGSYRAVFLKDPSLFLQHLAASSPSAVISETSCLNMISGKTNGLPMISLITGNIKKGLETSACLGAKCHIYRPYFEADLAHKLDTAIAERVAITKLESELSELEAIIDLTQLISSTLNPKELLFRIVKKISELMPVTRCSIIKVNWVRKAAHVVATFEDPDSKIIRLDLRKYPEIEEALKTRKPLAIKDTLMDPVMSRVRKIIEPLDIRSILVVPIFFREDIIGTLFLRTSRTGYTFSENEIRLMNALAKASSVALHNAFLFEQVEDEKARLEKLAITDYLTGIYNIRYFYHRIIEEFSRSQRYTLPISCLMIDIDFFKKINDEYGHKTGDIVLKEFAQILKKHTRKSDVLARYGGEEFIILLPHTAREGAVAEAERIREYVGKHRFKALKKKVGLTVSVGIALFPHPRINSHADLISYADDALFVAKHRGRNQVSLYDQQ